MKKSDDGDWVSAESSIVYNTLGVGKKPTHICRPEARSPAMLYRLGERDEWQKIPEAATPTRHTVSAVVRLGTPPARGR